MSAVLETQEQFYRGWLMGKGAFDPKEYGVSIDRASYLTNGRKFSDAYKGQWSIDELLLHPRETMRFCDDVRHKRKYYDVPDDIILRSVMIRRKNP